MVALNFIHGKIITMKVFFFVYFHSVVWVNDENMFWPYVNKAVWLTVALGGYFRYEGLLLGQIQYPSCYP